MGRLEKQKIPISKDLTDSKGKFESPNSVCVNKVQQKNEPNKEAELSQEQNVAHVQSTLSESTPLKEDIAQTLLEHDLSNQKAVLESSELSTEDKRDRDASLERVSKGYTIQLYERCLYQGHHTYYVTEC